MTPVEKGAFLLAGVLILWFCEWIVRKVFNQPSNLGQKHRMNRLAIYLEVMGVGLIAVGLWLVLTPSPPIPRWWVIPILSLSYAPFSETFQKWVDRKNSEQPVT